MNRSHLPNIHPGQILSEEFLKPMNVTAYRLSKEIGVPQTRVSAVLAGKRAITADTALRLARYFGNSPEFWMNLQTQYDLRVARSTSTGRLDGPDGQGLNAATEEYVDLVKAGIPCGP